MSNRENKLLGYITNKMVMKFFVNFFQKKKKKNFFCNFSHFHMTDKIYDINSCDSYMSEQMVLH